MNSELTYKAIVIGTSAGGMKLLKDLIIGLPSDFSLPVIIVQHILANTENTWPELLNSQSKIVVKEADEKEKILPGYVYVAPPNYHLLIESDLTFTLTVDERVNYARPSIDVLFETAAEAYGQNLIGIIGTGANFDGAEGLVKIKEWGGLTIVQDPKTAESPQMPKAAIEAASPDQIKSPQEILEFLLSLHEHIKSKSIVQI